MTLKRILPDLVAIVLFALLSFVYFFPADTEGRVLFQHDTAAGVGIGQTTVVAPTYLAEMAPRAIRGLCVCAFAGAVYM